MEIIRKSRYNDSCIFKLRNNIFYNQLKVMYILINYYIRSDDRKYNI